MIYNLIGRAVVKFGWIFLRRKADANRTLLAGVGSVAALALIGGVAGYILTRETPEA